MEQYKNIESVSVENEDKGAFREKEQKERMIKGKEQLVKLCQKFLNTPDTKNSVLELEAKFGTRGIKQLTRGDYDNVVKKLFSLGFIAKTDKYTLKIQPEFIDVRSGRYKTSDIENFRVEIKGINAIQEYCKTNLLPETAKIIRKTVVKVDDKSDKIFEPAEFSDFNFRVGLKTEETLNRTNKIVLDLEENWTRSKKIFRYINRTSFVNPDYPEFWIDLSIVRSSSKNERGHMIPSYNMDESDVLQNPETYELEIEVNGFNAEAKYRALSDGADKLTNSILNMTKILLCGLQKTNYPISYFEQRFVLQSYMRLLFENDYKKKGEEYVAPKFISPSNFLGPSSKALQIKNITAIDPDVNIPNITADFSFCVTDKADGERHLLYVNNTGKIYLINMNMAVIFTGAKTEQNECFNTLIDGELILHNKQGKFINMFAAFDLYYMNGNDVRHLPFLNIAQYDEKYFKEGTRLQLLNAIIKKLEPKSISEPPKPKEEPKKGSMAALLSGLTKKSTSPIKIVCKTFYPHFDRNIPGEPVAFLKYDIFAACNFILQKIRNGLYEYEVDGLIFTPTMFGVGGNAIGEVGPKRKTTWNYSFKWKPSEETETFEKSFLTIDYLVSTKKGPDGNDIVTPLFENGIDANEQAQLRQYKTLILTVGYDESQHGFINPCQDLLDDVYPDSEKQKQRQKDKKDSYKPKQFFPTEPYDPYAGLTNILLVYDQNNNYVMLSEDGEEFGDQTIVEFRYAKNNDNLWRWIPIRVRHDKTADFRAGLPNYGNDYKVANDNWYSIHNPVTEMMIATGQNIPSLTVGSDVYYNATVDDKITKRMRDFHNLYVKKRLITGVSKKGDILIDFACGKAGDFPKWISAGLAFVFGIDISKDNIENRLNGACARYLNYKKEFTTMPYALFVNGNCALNIRSGTNMFTDKANEITKSVFGQGPAEKGLGPAVKRQHSRGINGFDICSCQFAMHYMFENKNTFYNFLRNISECTKINGYFISTAYDGRTIFNLLKKLKEGESKEKYIDDKKIWAIQKNYDATTFPEDDTSLGFKISVFQDSINQSLPEFLVNYDFFTREMEKYGFSLVSRSEAKHLGFPESSGMFSELYNMMLSELDKDPTLSKDYKDAPYMTDYEKDISFLNRYFIYKKTSSRNAEKLTRAILDNIPDEYEFEQGAKLLARESVKKAEEEVKPKAKALKEKLKLQEATEALEEITTKQKAKTRKQNEEVQNDVKQDNTGEVIEKPKKTTRRKKVVEFDIIEE